MMKMSEESLQWVAEQPSEPQPTDMKLWAAVLRKCDELAEVTGLRSSQRGTAQWSGGKLHTRCHTYLHLDNGDGSDSVWLIEAGCFWRKGKIEVKATGPFLDNKDRHWENYAYATDPNTRRREVIVAGHHYMVGKGGGGGFGGRRFEIRFHDGRTVVTNDLWYQGRIPPAWQEQLPDNAEFVGDAQAFTGT